MELDVTPAPAESELAAVRRALARAGIRLDGLADVYSSAWRRAAAREAVDDGLVPGRYVLSPRRTRGATRA